MDAKACQGASTGFFVEDDEVREVPGMTASRVVFRSSFSLRTKRNYVKRTGVVTSPGVGAWSGEEPLVSARLDEQRKTVPQMRFAAWFSPGNAPLVDAAWDCAPVHNLSIQKRSYKPLVTTNAHYGLHANGDALHCQTLR